MGRGTLEKDAYYFPHFYSARNDRKIKRVRKELGVEGYGIFFMLLEVLREQNGYKYPVEDIDLLADEFGTSKQKLETVIYNYGLFKISAEDEFFSLNLFKYMLPYNEAKKDGIIYGIKGNLIKYKYKTKEELEGLTHQQIIDLGSKVGFTIPDMKSTSPPETHPEPDTNHIGLITPSQLKESKGDKVKEINKIKVKKNIAPKAELTAQSINPLYNSIKKSFLSKNGNQFTDYKKEGQSIKGLIKKAETRFPEDPGSFIKTAIEIFYDLTQSNDKYWNSQPFIPSRLNSSGIFDSVLKQMQEVEFVPTMPENMEDYSEIIF